VSLALVLVVVAVSLFWTTATVAQWSGRGLAMAQARSLDRLPSVIVDTKERLFLRSPGIEETALPAAPGQTFRYRYRNLRLLVHGNDRWCPARGRRATPPSSCRSTRRCACSSSSRTSSPSSTPESRLWKPSRLAPANLGGTVLSR
jgi:hypothetical protein